MKIRDKSIKQYVDVSRKDCQTFECYLPTSFRGDYFCGSREKKGCPSNPIVKGKSDET